MGQRSRILTGGIVGAIGTGLLLTVLLSRGSPSPAAKVAAAIGAPNGQPHASSRAETQALPSPTMFDAAPAEPTLPVASPGLIPTRTPAPALGEGEVPILYLHRVEAPPPDYPTWSAAQRAAFIDYDDIPAAFTAQLDWLEAHQYTAILPRDLAAHWDRGLVLPPRPVILTFDDGSPTWSRTILPALESHHMVAEFYLTLDAIANGRITWAEVRDLAATGNGIGAHDVHHVQLAMLGADKAPASPSIMWYEVHQARLTIGANVGLLPDSMAYVGGGYDATLAHLVKQAGYTTARTVVRGITQDVAHRFELRVVRIGPFDDVVDVTTGELVPDLPTFAARMAGVSDQVK